MEVFHPENIKIFLWVNEKTKWCCWKKSINFPVFRSSIIRWSSISFQILCQSSKRVRYCHQNPKFQPQALVNLSVKHFIEIHQRVVAESKRDSCFLKSSTTQSIDNDQINDAVLVWLCGLVRPTLNYIQRSFISTLLNSKPLNCMETQMTGHWSDLALFGKALSVSTSRREANHFICSYDAWGSAPMTTFCSWFWPSCWSREEERNRPSKHLKALDWLCWSTLPLWLKCKDSWDVRSLMWQDTRQLIHHQRVTKSSPIS